jgi:energy-coupling factor transport system permease protein
MKNLVASIREKISVEYVKSQILETTYGNRETLIAEFDPRILLAWYLAFAILPWLFFNRTILFGVVLLTASVAALSRVTGFVMFMLATGIVGELVGWVIVAMMFGGDLTVLLSLSTLMLKFLAVSLASIAVFSSMDPDRFSNALLAIGLPDQFALALSYGYRMVPTLLEEYERIIHAYRLRGREVENPGFLHPRSRPRGSRCSHPPAYALVLLMGYETIGDFPRLAVPLATTVDTWLSKSLSAPIRIVDR